MKIAVLSDIHLEFQPYDYEIPNADVLILSGDIDSGHCPKERMDKFLRSCYEKYNTQNVLRIGGNHEGYGRSWHDLPHVQICKEIDNYAFIGATLWSGEGSQIAYSAFLNDARKIHDFTWKKMYNQHLIDEKWIEDKLNYYHLTHKCIVFTHHLPSYECIDSIYKTKQNNLTTNKGFYVDEEYLIYKYNPCLWIYGHTHIGADFEIGKTRMICNPRGYPCGSGIDENEKFNSQLVLEI